MLKTTFKLDGVRGELELLVDTGSGASVIQLEHLLPDTWCSLEKSNLVGIIDQPYQSLGRVQLVVHLGNLRLKEWFEIVDKNFNLPVPGILGVDFFRDNKSTSTAYQG